MSAAIQFFILRSAVSICSRNVIVGTTDLLR